MTNQYLNTFVLVKQDRVISPVLTTTREYGNWLEKVFDSSICNLELYLKSKKADGTIVLEKHPGTRIGHFFDYTRMQSNTYMSWLVSQDSSVMDRLTKLKLAERKDTIQDKEGRQLLRLYTVNQIELYIQMNIDKSFHIDNFLTVPKQVRISDDDGDKLFKPEVDTQRKRLF